MPDALSGRIAFTCWRDEVTRRSKLLERHGAAKVTRKLASTVPGLHPIVVIFDETHELFGPARLMPGGVPHDRDGNDGGAVVNRDFYATMAQVLIRTRRSPG